MRTLTIAALIAALASPALAGSAFIDRGKAGMSRFSAPSSSDRIIGGKSISPKRHRHHRHEHHRSYDRPRHRSSYRRGGDVIIVVPQYVEPRRSRYQPLFGGLRR